MQVRRKVFWVVGSFIEQASKAEPAAQNEIRRGEVKSLKGKVGVVVVKDTDRSLEAGSTREYCEELACCQYV